MRKSGMQEKPTPLAAPAARPLGSMLRALGTALRWILWSTLSVLAPIVTGVLKGLALLATLTAGFFYSTLPPKAPATLGPLLVIAAGCLVTIGLWSVLTTLLAPPVRD